MAIAFIRVTSRPAGEAPAEIRDKWIGLLIPVQFAYDGAVFGVLSHQPSAPSGGYAVTWDDAMRVLGEAHPDAREWWERNVRGFPALVFDKQCCEIVPD